MTEPKSKLSLVKTPISIQTIMEQRGVCLSVSGKTIARMYTHLATGEVSFEDVNGDVTITEHSLTFKNLPGGLVKIAF
jgi:hypothetical protein